MPNRKDGKPKGAISSYAAFVQVCREEHKKKHPEDQIVFAEFSKKCAERWKKMGGNEKKRFEDIAAKDKARYNREMASYVPIDGSGKKKKAKKDPNAPKRALSAFFFYCAEFRAGIKADNPSYTIGDVAKELGKRWEKVTGSEKAKYEKLAQDDKKRYEKEMVVYRGGSPKKSKAVAEPMSDDDSDESD